MEKNIALQFSAIDPMVVKSIPEPIEKEYTGKGFVSYGVDNAYPQFLFDLVNECATLGSIVNGVTDYVKGNSISSTIMTQEEAEDFIEKTTADYLTFGAFYWQVIRNLGGKIAKVNWLDARYVRTDKDNNLFWYSEEFGKKYGRTNKAIVYPRYNPERLDPEAVICVKAPLSRGVYGNPIWSGAIKDAVIETKIEHCCIHANYEIIHSAADMICQRIRSIVAGSHRQSEEQFRNCHILTFAKEH